MTASDSLGPDCCALVNFIGIGVVQIGPDHKIKLWNTWMATHSGIASEQAVGQRLGDLFTTIRDSRIESAVDGAIRHQLSSVISPAFNTLPLPLYAAPNDRESGRAMRVSLSITPLDRQSGCLLQFTNVSAAMRREQLLRDRVSALRIAQGKLDQQSQELVEINKELEQFAYVVSHDMRQPLRMISSYLNLIERRIGPGFNDEVRGFFRTALDGAKHLDGMIHDLLDYSRTGRNAQYGDVSLAAALDNALQHLKPAIDEAKPVIATPTDLPVIHGNMNSLTRLFQNLIDNAIKYRRANLPPEIGIGWEAKADHILVWIRDNGIGIQPDSHDRAFLVFQRMVPKNQYDGNGIGLAVCKKIVEQHGGKIWIESQPNQGCTFWINLPATGGAAV